MASYSPPCETEGTNPKEGHVTLVGVAATEMERDVANLQASGVPGIFSVTNKLQVETKGRKT